MAQKAYICIDLKSFYASVECVERGLDPMTTDLVVADPERGDKTICLAVSPSLKAKGVQNRCRIFSIPKNISYIVAPPRMQKYIDYSAQIYGIYLRYFSPEDIHVYSVDEAFIDVTPYLKGLGLTPKQTALFMMDKISEEVGVRATAGVGTNLYLTKIALDITAKHADDFIGVLDEDSYRKTLWDHRPITDFWRIGAGTARRLEKMGIYTMRGVAEADADKLYKEFGIDAELLIDHANGIEPVTIADIHAYKPKSNCLSRGQVLMRDYTFDEARVILREMLDLVCLDMVDQNVITKSISFYIGYSGLSHCEPCKITVSLKTETNADGVIIPACIEAYNRAADKFTPIRRINISCNHLVFDDGSYQLSLFETAEREYMEKNRKIQTAVLGIKKRFGKDALLKGTSFDEASTLIERNHQIGGHKSGE